MSLSGTTKEYISKFTAKLDVKCTRSEITVTLNLYPDNKLALDICGKVELYVEDNDFIGGVTNVPLEIDMDKVTHDITWFNEKPKFLQIELAAYIDNANAEGFPVGGIWIDPIDKQEMMIIFTSPYRNNPIHEKELTLIDISEKYYDEDMKKKRLLDIEVLRKMITLDMVNSVEEDFTSEQKNYRDEHPLEYKVIEKAMDSDEYTISKFFLVDFVSENTKLDDVNRLAKAFLLNISNNKGGLNQLQDFLNDIFWAETSDFVDGLVNKLKPLFIPDELDNIDEISFDISELVKDTCRALEIKNYNPPTLDDAKEIKSSVVDYIFKEEFKTFTIRYFQEDKQAKVMKIECYNQKTGSKCKEFENDDNNQNIEGHWASNLIEIDLVYLGNAKGAGHCTHAVGYMLKVLLKESEKLYEYPSRGKVHIYSSKPCAAVNCYSHAFMINGFVPDSTEIAEFKERSKQISENGDKFDFTFLDFTSESQKIKMAAYKNKLMEKQRNAETKAYKTQLRKELNAKRRITRNMSKSIAKSVKMRRRRLAKILKKKKVKKGFLPQLKF